MTDQTTAFGLIDLWDSFGAGVYLLFGVINLDLWIRRRNRLGHLWLAGASASALVVDVTGIAGRHLEGVSLPWLAALNNLGAATATAFLFELVSSLCHRKVGPVARAFQGILIVLAVVSGLLLPRLISVTLLGCFAFLLWAMVRAVQAARGGDRDSRVVARGFIVLNACLVADLLQELEVFPFPSGLPLVGFIVLFLASARSLNDRFEREEVASRTDTLTGLPNRRGLLEASDWALLRSRRSQQPVSVVIADIDHFKAVNDSLGHPAGDAALKALAAALRASLRAQDMAARWGGEEFILLLPDTSREGALHVAESLRAAVSRLPIEFEGARIAITLSLGVAEHREGKTIEDTIAEADAGLYRAKQEGRNRVRAR